MMPLLESMLTNAVLATLLAITVSALAVLKLRPPVLHALYVVVLVRLIAPPVWETPLPGLGGWRTVAPVASMAAPEHRAAAAIPRDDYRTVGALPEQGTITAPDEGQSTPALSSPSHEEVARRESPNGVATEMPLLDNGEEPRTAAEASGPLEPTAPPNDASPAPIATSPIDVHPPGVDWPRLLGLVWLVGCSVWLILAAVRIGRMHAAVRRAVAAPPAVRAIVERLALELQLKRPPRMVVMEAPVSPAIWPIGPYLVFPRVLLDRIRNDELAPLVAHELVHLRRRDHWVRLLELAVTSIYWWLPTLWWVRRKLRSVEEECCDAGVVQLWPESAAAYARSLVAAIEILASPRSRRIAHPATGMGDVRGMQTRLKRIMQMQTSYRPTRRAWAAIAGVAAVCWIVTPGSQAEVDVAQHPDASGSDRIAPPPDELGWTFDRLPPTCDVLYKVLSPDGRQVAWVGSNVTAAGTREHGLFVVDLDTGAIRRLLEQAIKTAPAWSPDSRYLAVGNAPGYVTRYPLVIVDVETGRVDQTGVLGVGAAWSPDGSEIACSTEIQRGGSWSGGVPVDGRIGVWNIDRRQMRFVTPPAFHVYIQETRSSAMAGAVRPKWSPGGEWIAFELVARVRRGDEEESRHELWAVNREGTEMRGLLEEYRPHRWSKDGRSIVLEGSGGEVALADASVATVADWPKPPPDFVEAEAAREAARARARGFDHAPIFNRNRPWQNPRLDHLESVEFTHRMSPMRLDERFSWRADGACSVEVVHREDEHAESEIGRIWLLTPSGEQLTLGAGARYPKRESLAPDQVTQETLMHLMGTRFNCVAQDWARNPDWFELADVRASDVAGQRILELRPRRTRDRRRYYLNIGAMFHTTSWAYMHHLAVSRAELVVDEETGRILKEIDYIGGDEPVSFEFTDWLDLGDGQSVPQSIRVAVPSRDFRCAYRFQWLRERLWLLESGESAFAGKEPQREEIVELAVNGDDPDVDRHLSRLRERLEMLEPRAGELERELPVRTIPFELGRAVPLKWTHADSPPAAVREVRFTVGESGERFREMWVHPTVRLELELDGSDAGTATGEPAQLVVYDDRGRPVHVFAIPLGAAQLLRRPATEFAARIRGPSSLWLNPDPASLPNATYRFHHSEDKAGEYSTADASNPHFVRGVTMTLALDALTRNPDLYRMPVAFEAQLDGRPVEVAIITGPSFGWLFGNGIDQSWRGYTVSTNTAAVVVIDQENGRPLLERYGDTEVHFLDYVQPQPGQYAPQRIVVRRDGKQTYNFRFQVLDGRVWLFDRSYSADGDRVVYVDAIHVDSRPPHEVSRNKTPAAAPVNDFDWSALTQRQLLADADQPLARQLASTERPFASRNFEFLTRMTITGPASARIDLGRSLQWHSVRSWSLTHASRVAQAESAPAEQSQSTEAVPIGWGEVIPIHVAARVPGLEAPDETSGTSWLRTARLEQGDDGRVTGTLELVSRQHYTEQSSVIAAVLLDADAVPVASAEAEQTFLLKNDVYSEEILLDFGILPPNVAPTHVTIGFGTTQIGAPMGSVWGRFMGWRPIFPIEQLLSSISPQVILVGLQELYRSVEEHIRHRERGRGSDRAQRVVQGIAPFTRYLEKSFSASEDVDTLALVCRLAGHSGQRQFVPTLVKLLDHPDAAVQDGAAIGLGLLGDERAVDRVRALFERTKDRPNPSQHDRQLLAESWIVLDQLGEALEAE